MARTNNLTNFLTDVADSIREKTGKSEPIPCEDFDTEIESISGGGEPNLQTKSVTITSNTTTNVVADTGYDGLESVSITTNVPTSGDIPSVGVIFSEWDASGYPHKAEIVGMTAIPSYYFARNNAQGNEMTKQIENIIFPNNLTAIRNSAFITGTNLSITALPDTITTLEANCFTGCTKLALQNLPASLTTIGASALRGTGIVIKTLPSTLQTLTNQCFGSCTKIHQLSMPNVTTIPNANYNGIFYQSSNLYAVWIGSSITDLGRYSLQGPRVANFKRIFINLPRATVESFSGYSYGFMNTADVINRIVCNDDTGWKTKEEFDAIDWENYTEG